MEELAEIIKQHATLYPEMKPVDVTKLVFQNEFGVHHLIQDENLSYERILEELKYTDSNESELYTNIGNGLVRVNLNHISVEEIDKLNQALILTAKKHRGNLLNFSEKLAVIVSLCYQGIFNFEPKEFEEYIHTYLNQKDLMVSHSETYRNLYHPHYRVVKKEYLGLLNK